MVYEAIDIWSSPSLMHYGVKGMKWGVRKQREVNYSQKSSNKKQYSNTQSKKMSTGKKIAIGVGAVAGAVALGAVAYTGAQYTMGSILIKALKASNSSDAKTAEAGRKMLDVFSDSSNSERKSIYKQLKKSGTYDNPRNPIKNSKILGKPVVETPTMKTPVKFITKAPSIKRRTNTMPMATAPSIISEQNKKYKRQKQVYDELNSWSGRNAKSMASNRNMLRMLNPNSFTYNPSYTTKSGNKIKKRLRPKNSQSKKSEFSNPALHMLRTRTRGY